jgi:hypothetical protein
LPGKAVAGKAVRSLARGPVAPPIELSRRPTIRE